MPLHTTIIRDGEAAELHWSGFHIAAMVLTVMAEEPRIPHHEKVRDLLEVWHRTNGPDAPMPISPGDAFALTNYGIIGDTALNDGAYTVKERHVFTDLMDGEVLEILPGDELRAWRN